MSGGPGLDTLMAITAQFGISTTQYGYLLIYPNEWYLLRVMRPDNTVTEVCAQCKIVPF